MAVESKAECYVSNDEMFLHMGLERQCCYAVCLSTQYLYLQASVYMHPGEGPTFLSGFVQFTCTPLKRPSTLARLVQEFKIVRRVH